MSDPAPPPGRVWPPVPPLQAGLRCRCPRCGQGKLFKGLLDVTKSCAVCGLDLTAHDSGDGPAVFAIFLLGFIVVPLALGFEAAFAPPIWLHLVIWPFWVISTPFQSNSRVKNKYKKSPMRAKIPASSMPWSAMRGAE